MMGILEGQRKIQADGGIAVPSQVWGALCIRAGDQVTVAYLGNHPELGSGELITNSDWAEAFEFDEEEEILDYWEDEEADDGFDEKALMLPQSLLEAAGLDGNRYLEVQFSKGMVVITQADPLGQVPAELMILFDELGINHETVRQVLLEGDLDDAH